MPSVNFLWDPIEQNVIAEFDDDGNLIVDYTTEPELYGNVISQHRDGETNVFYSDTLGSTLAVTNQAGGVIATRAYSVFGETTESFGDLVFPFQYIGQRGYYLDSETGGYSIRRRIYDPPLGRWKSFDPAIFGFLNLPTPFTVTMLSQNFNGYSYAHNRPFRDIDPSGMIPSGMPESSGCHFITFVDESQTEQKERIERERKERLDRETLKCENDNFKKGGCASSFKEQDKGVCPFGYTQVRDTIKLGAGVAYRAYCLKCVKSEKTKTCEGKDQSCGICAEAVVKDLDHPFPGLSELPGTLFDIKVATMGSKIHRCRCWTDDK